jgi:hypothetical protein
MMTALQSMVLQTDGKKIFLLPTWPRDWNLNFKLHAPYNTVIEGEYVRGVIKNLKVTPNNRKKDIIIR